MRPPERQGKLPFGTASPPASSHPHDNLHLSPTHRLIFESLRERYGETYAQTWLKKEQKEGRGHHSPELHRATQLLHPVATEKFWVLDHPEEGSEPLRDALRSPKSRLEQKIRVKTYPPRPPQTVKTLSEIDPAQEAGKRMSKLEAKLHPSVRLLYRVLLELAFTIAKQRGYAQGVSRVTFHCPLEIVAYGLGVHRVTIWRWLDPLTRLGLIACRDHTTTVKDSPSSRSNNLTDGKLWNIKLDPSHPEPARLSIEEFKTQWRDLEGDIERGRTAYNFVLNAKTQTPEKAVQQSNTEVNIKRSIELILEWALPPSLNEAPSNMTVAPALEAILDLPGTPRGERNKMVDVAAKAVTYALGDGHAYLPFYRRLLWNLLRRYDQGQDYFMTVYVMILRARADFQEGFARRAGALLHSRLKAWPVWDELRRTPPLRVGVSPLAA